MRPPAAFSFTIIFYGGEFIRSRLFGVFLAGSMNRTPTTHYFFRADTRSAPTSVFHHNTQQS